VHCSYFATAKGGRSFDYESLDLAVQDLKNRLEVAKDKDKVTEELRLKNSQNLVFAPLLGFAPNILVNILRSQSEAIKGQMKSTSPSDGIHGAMEQKSCLGENGKTRIESSYSFLFLRSKGVNIGM